MAPRTLYILLIILTACSSTTGSKNDNLLLGEKTSYKTPELAIILTRAIKTLDNEIHGVSFMSNKGKHISKDTLISILYEISKKDRVNKDTYETYARTCNNVEVLTWKAIENQNVLASIEKINSETSIPLSDGSANIISVTDFKLLSFNKPNHISLRIVDNYDLNYLKIDEVEYTRFAESIPVGLHEAIAKADSLRKNACR